MWLNKIPFLLTIVGALGRNIVCAMWLFAALHSGYIYFNVLEEEKMSLVDDLLKMDAATITEVPTGEIEITRLSAKIGKPFIVKCRAVNGERYSEIQKNAVDFTRKGRVKDVNISQTRVLTILDGVVEPNLKDQSLLTHFQVATPKELLYKMFLSGELDDIKKLIEELSGYEEDDEEETTDAAEEIKN